jgi:RNA-directed DNA polymerase
MTSDDEKKLLYRRIAGANKFRVLERMRVLGFWPKATGLPAPPPDEAAELKQIEDELGTLRKKSLTAEGKPDAAIEKALKVERLRRWEESKKRRAEKKKLREAQAAERRAAWNDRKKTLVPFAGEGVSGGLGKVTGDDAKLAAAGLPIVHTGAELAQAMGIPIARLRWLTFHRSAAPLVHYHRYSVPKKTGGIRAISAPKPELARVQHWVQDQVLARIPTGEHAHGFVVGRSIVTNAQQHAGKQVVVNLDLKDFFPTVTFGRGKGLFESFGYSEEVATLLSLVCTEPPRVAVEIKAEARTFVAIGARAVPQGACTSPALTNLVCRALDRRLAALARKHGYTYTRYADDLTFSGDRPTVVGRLLRSVRSIIADEGFVEHPSKTKVMRRTRRQEVTGLTVNDRPQVARAERKRLRAILHNAKRTSLDAQNREAVPDFGAHLRGKIAFVHMVDARTADKLRTALDEVTR